MALFDELRERLAAIRDAAATNAELTLADLLIKESYEAEEAFEPIDSVEYAKMAVDYERKALSHFSVRVEPSPQQVALAPLVEQYIDEKSKEWKQATTATSHFRQVWNMTGMLSVSDINKDNVRAFKKVIRERYNGQTPQGHFLKAQGFVSWLMSSTDVIATNPFKEVGGFKNLKRVNEKGVVNAEIYADILANVRPMFVPMVSFLYWTGCNIKEAIGIQQEHWFEEKGIKAVVITDVKNEYRKRAVPLHREVLHLWGTNLMWPTKSNSVNSLTVSLNRELEPWGVTSHSFRHCMTNRLRALEIPDALRYHIVGHSPKGTSDRVYGSGWPLSKVHEVIERLEP
ncbi:hypothetical protein [Parendozoicomonas haliclonae]|uniref:Phage integrase family protein n=1 Tax=Parendozoicomonas haliclonae TaxID=1960125 RepID=A0A1X7AKR0_9GAMM|nr:hypothetical protein [Parendozoicomonas haliclonae]SMA47352.1 hypothetical protein EHSB41UT_02380 [Parendozoicomonas haliclonae]